MGDTAGNEFRLAIDPWAADYDGGAGQLDLDEPTASVDAGVETATWQAIRPAPRTGAPPELCFVDGVRRIELRFVAEIGLRRARDKVAADPKLPADLKAEVLKQLDAEIAKFEKQG